MQTSSDLCLLSMQRFLILELDLDNLLAHNRARLPAPAVGHNFRKVRSYCDRPTFDSRLNYTACELVEYLSVT